MKFIPILFFVLSASIAIVAQSENPVVNITRIPGEYEKECGKRIEESQSYSWMFGKVTKVLSSNRIAVVVGEGTEKKVLKVVLAGIAPNTNRKALRDFLVRHLLDKRVSITGNAETMPTR